MMLFHEGRAETTDGGIQYTTLFHHVEWTPKSRECLDLLLFCLNISRYAQVGSMNVSAAGASVSAGVTPASSSSRPPCLSP
jgi:hypothetical protein